MKLILVRHAETSWNKKAEILSYTDIPLNETGRKQAKLVAEKLKTVRFEKIFSSPLSRALDTAKEINKYHKLEIQTTNLLKERNYGDFEKTNYHQLNLKKIKEKNLYKKFNMETPKEFENRIKEFLEKQCCKNHKEKVLIVSHSGTIKMILFHLLKIEESFEIFRKTINKTNTSISTIEFDKKFNVIKFEIGNDTHLN